MKILFKDMVPGRVYQHIGEGYSPFLFLQFTKSSFNPWPEAVWVIFMDRSGVVKSWNVPDIVMEEMYRD